MSDARKPAYRAARRAAGCALLGAVVTTGPWTVPAAGDDSHVSDRPGPRGTSLYDIPFLPHGGVPPWPPRPPRPHPLTGEWTAPVTGHPVSARYGIPGGWAAGYHTGVDFATPVGVPVSAVGPGTVVFAEDAGDYGEAVLLRMTDDHYTLYAHLSEIAVPEGREVSAGTRIGRTGDTGRSTGPHLHFEARSGPAYGTDVDPVAYLARHGVVLR
jgi:murein DD-endopeptidase MepM/ murein hydrolase activator NlpD